MILDLRRKNIEANANKVKLDIKPNDSSNDNFNLYSVNSFIDSGYLRAENRIAEEQFEQQLSTNESYVLMLLKKRLTISEIAQKLEISEEKVEFFAKTVAMKRKQFFS